MQNDLISRSELKETLMECLDETQIQETLEFFGIYDFIDNAPTAYNVKKVVEQLEKEKITNTEPEATHAFMWNSAIQKAIACVMNGEKELK